MSLATSASCQVVWLRRLLNDMSHTENEPTPIFCDNTSTIALSKNHVFHKKSKHIDTRFHFIRELVNSAKRTSTKHRHQLSYYSNHRD
jgi:hypothetical protein